MLVGRERVGGHVRCGSQLASRSSSSLSCWQNKPRHTFVQVNFTLLTPSVASSHDKWKGDFDFVDGCIQRNIRLIVLLVKRIGFAER